jgi:hypothetical protein
MTTRETTDLFTELFSNEKRLTTGQLIFIRNVKKHFAKNKILSEKQTSALVDIRKYLNEIDKY